MKTMKTRQNLVGNHGFTFIRINPDPDPEAGFDLDVEIAKIYTHLNESPLKLAVDSAEKSLKEKFAKKLLSYMSSFSGTLKCIKYFIKKNIACLIKKVEYDKYRFKSKEKPRYVKKEKKCLLLSL